MDRRSTSSGHGGTNTLGKYRLLAELGRGGMAEVFLAVAHGPAGFNKLVVLKQIMPALAEDPEFLAMFLDEARLAARLSHPNVVQTNEVGDDHGQYFIAMEYLEGQPLNRILHRLGRDGALPLGMHLRILVDALAGLHHAHELADYDGTPLDVVHRDATPHNIFLTYDGQVKVVDFGIAKAMNSSSETRTGVLKGKVAYMSPEQARGEQVDRRADVFSVGVMMWEALVQRRLWKGMNDVGILHHIASGNLPFPSTLRAGIPPVLEAVCMRALAKDRDRRYATAAELGANIEAALDEVGERGTVRAAGKLIEHHFAEERARIRAIIDGQLSTAIAMPTAEYRAVELPVLAETSGATSASNGDPSQAARPLSITPSTLRAPASSSAQHATPLALSTSAEPSVPPPAPRRGLAAAAGIGAALALGAIGLWVATSGPAAAPDAGTAASLALQSAAVARSAEPAAPREVSLKVVATPPEAELFLDGRSLGRGPYAAKLAADTSPHELRVEAPGFATTTRELRLDRDADLTIALDTEKKGTPKRTTTPRAPTTPAPDPASIDDGFKTTPKPKRAIDPSNPYGQ